MKAVPAGNMVLIEGIDIAVTKTSTITSQSNQAEVSIVRPIKFWTTPTIKVAI